MVIKDSLQKVTNEVVDVVFPHFVQPHLQQHVYRGDTCERHMIDLLVVRLQDELAERAAAISVNLDKVNKTAKLNTQHRPSISSSW